VTVGTGTPFFEAEQRGIGKAVLIGVAVASVIVWTFVALVALWAGAHLVESIAMGAFAAFFGGPGFGGMLGAVIFLERKKTVSVKAAPGVVVSTPAAHSHGSTAEPLVSLRTGPQERAEPVGSGR